MTEEQFAIVFPMEPGTAQADGFAGHCQTSDYCQFRLHHQVLSKNHKRYRVSSIGAMAFDDSKEFESVRCGHMYESVVIAEDENGNVSNWSEIDADSADCSIEMTKKHYALVEKYKNM